MIVYSQLGKKGNLGNQMFQIASTIGIAKKHQQDFSFPEWNLAHLFEYELPVCSIDKSFVTIREKEFNHHEWNISNNNYDIVGWLQTEKYFDIPMTKEVFKFKNNFVKNILENHQFLFEKKTILVSVRRGDFVNNPNYFQLSYKYYILALINNFPDFKDRIIVFTSDDIDYCKFHYSFLKNAFFLENLCPMEQIVIGSHCDDFIISNSTFSWWVAWLGEKKGTRIYRPEKNLRGDFAVKNNDKDFFPERWISFSEKDLALPFKYYDLVLKGEVYIFFANVKYIYKISLKKTKKRIKKMIGRK
jgi:hypothetical protein